MAELITNNNGKVIKKCRPMSFLRSRAMSFNFGKKQSILGIASKTNVTGHEHTSRGLYEPGHDSSDPV